MPATTVVYTNRPDTLSGPLSFRRGGQSRFVLPDLQGHARQLTDSAGTVTDTLTADAWGVPKATSGATVNPYQAFGQWGYFTDTPSRLYVRARHLRVDVGRWVSRDPMGFEGGDWNVFRYIDNNPIRTGDPMGLSVDVTNCDRDPKLKNGLVKACDCIRSMAPSDWQKINACILRYRRKIYTPCDTLSRQDQGCMRDYCKQGCGELHCSWKEDCHTFLGICPAKDCRFCYNDQSAGCGLSAPAFRNIFGQCTTMIVCVSNMGDPLCNCMGKVTNNLACTVFHELNHICNWDPEDDEEKSHYCSELVGMCIAAVCGSFGS